MSNWADDSDDESIPQMTLEDFGKMKFVSVDGTDVKRSTWETTDFARDQFDDFEDFDDIEILTQEERKKNEIFILTDPDSKIFHQTSTHTICNYDLTPLLKQNFPNFALMKAISETFSDNVSEDGIAPPLKQKFFEPLVDSEKNQMRYVIKTQTGVSFVLRREDYRDYGEDVIHQYVTMSLIAAKVWQKVPMIAYPFGIFSASKNCEYTGDAERDKDRLYNFLLMSYVPFNREDNTGENKLSNDPGKRQMSFHVAMAPPQRGPRLVKPLLSPKDGWYLIQMMNAFLRYASYFYVFSHGDAHYHNWYLRDLGDVQAIEIPVVVGGELQNEEAKVFYTRYLPVLSDFGRSSFVYDKQRYGMNSKYYAVPPPYEYIDYHDILQLMYGFTKDLDYVKYEYATVNYKRVQNYWLKVIFNSNIEKHLKLYPELEGVDISKGLQGRGTSFAEVSRLLSGKIEIVKDIYEQLDQMFKTDITLQAMSRKRPLRPSTDPVRVLSMKCPPMRSFPEMYKNPKAAEEDARSRSEMIIYLRENDEDEDIEDIRNYLFNYFELTMKTNIYDSKEGLVIDLIVKRLADAGIKYTEEEKELFKQFQQFKGKKDSEQKEKKFETSSAQSGLSGQQEYVESRASSSRGGYSRGGYSRGGYSRDTQGRSYTTDSEGFRTTSRRR